MMIQITDATGTGVVWISISHIQSLREDSLFIDEGKGTKHVPTVTIGMDNGDHFFVRESLIQLQRLGVEIREAGA